MKNPFLEKLYRTHCEASHFPFSSAVLKFGTDVLQMFFPSLSDKNFASFDEFDLYYRQLRCDLLKIVQFIDCDSGDCYDEKVTMFFNELPSIYELLMMDAEAITKGDPAARNIEEVTRTYPGFYAIAVYRIAHCLCSINIPLLPRMLTEFAHSKTGIDINPGAKIGTHFCIDHGTGLVIGETTIIGNNVKLYQGVTLGAISVDKSLAKTKRHPTIEDNVIVYSGATILGGETVIGHNSIIGGNVWLTESVPPFSAVYHQAKIKVRKKDKTGGN